MDTHRPVVRAGLSLAGFRSPVEVRNFEQAAAEAGLAEPFYELSYTLGESFLRELAFLKGRVLSVHAPCPAGELFPNLASSDSTARRASIEAIRRSAGTAARFQAGRLVLHPGYATDSPVPIDPAKRLAALAEAAGSGQRPRAVREGSICGYRAHLQTAIDGLGEAADACASEGVVLAVENLNPRITYLFQLPSDLAALAKALPVIRVCVDVGHLWISSLAHGFAFSDGMARILETGKVVAAHIHDNSSRLGPPAILADEHALIGSGRIPLVEAIRLLLGAGVSDLIAETTTLPLENLVRLTALLPARLPERR